MTPIVETLRAGDTLATVRRQLERGHIRHLPVIDRDERVIGLVTHRDLLGAWLSHGDPSIESTKDLARDVSVEMIMEKNVRTIPSNTPAVTAAALLEAHTVGCLPVVDGGRLVGIVTAADFVRFARRYFEWEAHGEPRPPKQPAKRGN